MPRQVEMADEQNFIQFGKTLRFGLAGNIETTKCILRIKIDIER